jgi:hypothetical protein
VAPQVHEVVVVNEALSRAEPEVGQADMGTVQGVQLSSVDLETMEVYVVPAEGDLEDIVQAGEGGVGADEQAAPDQGADPPQYDPQLVDGRGSSWKRFGDAAILARRILGRRGEPLGHWGTKPNLITLASHGFSHSRLRGRRGRRSPTQIRVSRRGFNLSFYQRLERVSREVGRLGVVAG